MLLSVFVPAVHFSLICDSDILISEVNSNYGSSDSVHSVLCSKLFKINTAKILSQLHTHNYFVLAA